MDTFQYSCGNHLEYDSNSDTKYQLNCTGGTYEEVTQNFCDNCGASIEEDEEYYCEDVDETRCESCCTYSEVDDTYYAEENVTYIGGNVESYVHNRDIER